MDDKIALWLTLIPALPLAAAILCAVCGPRLLRQYSHVPVIVCLLGSFVGSCFLLREMRHARQTQQDAAEPDGVEAGFERIVTLWTWADVPEAYPRGGPRREPTSSGAALPFRIDIQLRVDSLTAMMLAMVTFVSTLIAVFSAGYMHGDRSYWRFFSYLALFVFSMTMLVAVSNFVLLYVFWEAVGVCSYLLIGFWYEKPEAAAAGFKAFLVNRVGDAGLALALFLIWTTYGTLNFHDTWAATGDATVNGSSGAGSAAGTTATASAPQVVRGVLSPARIANNDYAAGTVGLAICLLLMCGACGKSAQFPLHVWLPDAMEGPTPVSALIHAATMVTAGVYLVARCSPLFMVSPTAQVVVACVGGFTALLAALIALTQFDLKRVLAYSTISQLGYMFLGLGAGTFLGITSGLFHLFTHAFFKALLFLGAGSVMHAMGGVIDMRRFGGLRRVLPLTHATFFVGCCALAGLPPFSGFWSKDAVVASIEEKAHALSHAEAAEPGDSPAAMRAGAAHDPEPISRSIALVYHGLYYCALFTGFLTAFYTFRAFYLTFYGPEEIPAEAGGHAHESPPVMGWPLVLLAVGAGAVGFCLDQTYTSRPMNFFAEFLGSTPSFAGGLVAASRTPYVFHGTVAIVSVAVAGAGLLLASYVYLGDRVEARWLKSAFDFEAFSRWYDAQRLAGWGNQRFVAATHRAAQRVGLGWLTAAAGRLVAIVAFVLAWPLLLGNFVSPYKLSLYKFFFDEIYAFTIVAPLRLLARGCYLADRAIVDGLVNLVGSLPPAVGLLMRSLQMGLLQFYALAMFLGLLVLIATKLILGMG